MLSVGELPTIQRVLKEWRRVNYKKDPIFEQLYHEEFIKDKNKSARRTPPVASPVVSMVRQTCLTNASVNEQALPQLQSNVEGIVSQTPNNEQVEESVEMKEEPYEDDGGGGDNAQGDDKSKAQESEEQNALFRRESVQCPQQCVSALTQSVAMIRRENLIELIVYLCCSLGVSTMTKPPPMRIRVPEGTNHLIYRF